MRACALPPRLQADGRPGAGVAGDLSIRPLDKRNLARDLDIIIDIFNDAWSGNWGFVPMTAEEIAALGKNLKMLVARGLYRHRRLARRTRGHGGDAARHQWLDQRPERPAPALRLGKAGLATVGKRRRPRCACR